MYFVMSKLDAAKFCKLDFIVNFGILPAIKTQLVTFLEQSTGKNEVVQYLETLETLTLLKIHKYFLWADKKLHSHFFIEDKDQISEDLLVDFKDEEYVKAYI